MKPTEHYADALARQMGLESLHLSAGLDRLRLSVARLDKLGRRAEAADTKALLTKGVQPVAAYLDAVKRDGRAIKHLSWEWLNHLSSEEVAYLALHTMLSAAGDMPMTQQSVARILWNAVADELRSRELHRLADEAKDAGVGADDPRRDLIIGAKRSAEKAKLGATADRMHKEVAYWIKATNAALASPLLQRLEVVDRTQDAAISVGMQMLRAVLEATAYFTIQTGMNWKSGYARPRMETTIQPTEDTLAWIARRGQRLGLLHPVWQPLVVPPRPWSKDGGPCSGGYHGALAYRAPMVRRVDREQATAIVNACEPVVFDALNAVQRVGWRINARVFDVFDALWKAGGALAKVPATRPEEKPTRPEGARPKKGEEVTPAWREYRKALRKRKKAEAKRAHNVLRCARKRVLARSLLAEEQFWYAWSADWRGRIYPLADGLSPQGCDLERGLLAFAEGRALGDTGLDALLLHAANCLGKLPDGRKVSRLTLEERHEAMMNLLPFIHRTADAPLEHRAWMDADEPWQFLAAAFDITDAIRSGDPASFASNVVVAVDGTCNGLQHWSALMRDEDVARRVNVAPLPRPADVYTDVTEAVLADLEHRAREGDEMATKWLSTGLITRSLCKRPVMTSVYGSGVYGYAEQIRELVLEEHTEIARKNNDVGPLDVFRDADKGIKLSLPARYLGERINDALAARLGGAVVGMAWVQMNAKVAGKHGNALSWRVPLTGWLVEQPYRRTQVRRIKSLIRHGSGLVAVRIPDPSGKADGRKQATAAAPNVIHSLDAACLHLVAAECGRPEVNVCLAPVHDSFGTHAGTLGTLRAVTREAFVRLHLVASLDSLAMHFAGCVPADKQSEVPPTPARGTLDIMQTLSSAYLFS